MNPKDKELEWIKKNFIKINETFFDDLITFVRKKYSKEVLSEVEKMIDRCFLKENLLIDNIIQTGKTVIGTKADIKFMKNYKLELLELECEVIQELQKLKEKK